MDLKPDEVQLDTLLSGLALQHFSLNELLSLTLTAKQWQRTAPCFIRF